MKHLTAGFVLSAALVMAQTGFRGPGRYEIANLKSGRVLDLDRNEQTTVIQYSARGTDNQRWDLEPADPGFWFIRNATNGRALQPARNGNGAELICARFDRSADQQWRIQPGKDGDAWIVSRNGRTLDVPDGSNREGLHLQIYDLNGDSNQRFILTRVGTARVGAGRDPASRRGVKEMERTWDDREDGACFYRGRDFRGEAVCSRPGVEVGDAGQTFGSLRLFGRTQGVEVYERPGLRGERIRLNRDVRDLENIGDHVGSFRVF
jgi:hypothetical protein